MGEGLKDTGKDKTVVEKNLSRKGCQKNKNILQFFRLLLEGVSGSLTLQPEPHKL